MYAGILIPGVQEEGGPHSPPSPDISTPLIPRFCVPRGTQKSGEWGGPRLI